jgi:hypothetical protein
MIQINLPQKESRGKADRLSPWLAYPFRLSAAGFIHKLGAFLQKPLQELRVRQFIQL